MKLQGKQHLSDSASHLGQLLSEYAELVLSLKARFPRTDPGLLFALMSHEFLHADHVPTLQIEIFYKDGIDLHAKADAASRIMDRVPAVYESENRLVIEPRLQLRDIEELAQDVDIESLGGDVLCCIDSVANRRKHLI